MYSSRSLRRSVSLSQEFADVHQLRNHQVPYAPRIHAQIQCEHPLVTLQAQVRVLGSMWLHLTRVIRQRFLNDSWIQHSLGQQASLVTLLATSPQNLGCRFSRDVSENHRVFVVVLRLCGPRSPLAIIGFHVVPCP